HDVQHAPCGGPHNGTLKLDATGSRVHGGDVKSWGNRAWGITGEHAVSGLPFSHHSSIMFAVRVGSSGVKLERNPRDRFIPRSEHSEMGTRDPLVGSRVDLDDHRFRSAIRKYFVSGLLEDFGAVQ